MKPEDRKKPGRKKMYEGTTIRKTFVIPKSHETQLTLMVKAFLKSCEIKR